MNRILPLTAMSLSLALAASWAGAETTQSPEGRRAGRGRKANAATLRSEFAAPRTLSLVLGRPTDRSVVVSVLSYVDKPCYVAYGTHPQDLTDRSGERKCRAEEPVEILIDSLRADTQYYYELRDATSNKVLGAGAAGRFHTQRPPGSNLTFTVQADPHLDEGTSPATYERTLTSALSDKPDFHIDLGDTFMVDKYRNDYRASARQYLAQRYYFGLLCRSAPLFLVLGNHDGERGGRDSRGTDDMAGWSNLTRKKYFPNPRPGGIYSGNSAEQEGVGLLEDYYAWEWGDALFIVLDPYWYTSRGSRQSRNGWAWTLGDAQYQWLQRTLTGSKARFKFVFIHHLVGGRDDNARGGAEVAKYFEWGGHDPDGRFAFTERRPGWTMPIHQLLVRNSVSVVFHGHDHFFAKQDLDGMVYQLVPQPGHTSGDSVRSAAEYGYVRGDILGGSGYVRAGVSRSQVMIEYVRIDRHAQEGEDRGTGTVAHSYTIPEAGRRMHNEANP